MYRNYDGAKSAFGDTSVSATAPSPDNVSAFAAVRSSDGALTVMVVSKYLAGSTPASLNLSQFAAGPAAHVWQLTASNSIQKLADVTVSKGAIMATLPQQSITLFVIPASIGGSCDLNGDGVVNVVDVQLTIDQVLGIFPCTTADLQHSGQCNVVDVQRVVNAALGGKCVTGP
jgi:hypothetical protein